MFSAMFEEEDNLSSDSDIFEQEYDEEMKRTDSEKSIFENKENIANENQAEVSEEAFILSFGMTGTKKFQEAFNEISSQPVETRRMILVLAQTLWTEAQKQTANVHVYRNMYLQKVEHLQKQNKTLKEKLINHENGVQNILQKSIMPKIQQILNQRPSQCSKLQEKMCKCIQERDSINREIQWLEEELSRLKIMNDSCITKNMQKLTLSKQRKKKSAKRKKPNPSRTGKNKKRNSVDMMMATSNTLLDNYIHRKSFDESRKEVQVDTS